MVEEIFEEEGNSNYSDVNSEADSEAEAKEDSSGNPDKIKPRHLHSCQAGSMPTVEEIFEEEDNSNYSDVNSEVDSKAEAKEDSSGNPDEIEPGDQVFMTTVYDPAEFI
jgi:hypothetical protein